MDLLTSIGTSIIVAALLAVVAQRLGQPLIIGYIVAGALLGPHVGLGLVHDEESIELIAEIGLVLLLFLIGLELSLPRLLQAGRVIIVCGLLKVPICAAVAWFVLAPVAALTGGPFDRLYLAIGTGFASTLILVKLLSDKGELTTFSGRVTLGILVFEDLYAIAFLALQPNLTSLQAGPLLRSLGSGVALLGAALLAARFVLPPLLRRIATSPELLLVVTMAWCFVMAGAGEHAGLSKEMGALIAGVVIASFPYGTEVIPRVTGIRDFFITLFFVALGLKIPPPSPRVLLLAVGVAAFVMVVQFVATYPLFAALRLDLRTASVVGINLGQISEFSLVVFSLGLGLGHVSADATALVLYTLLLTAVVSTYGILDNQRLAGGLTRAMERLGAGRWFGTAPVEAGGHGGGHGADVFLLGVGREGLILADYVERHAPGLKPRLAAIDVDTEMLEALGALGVASHYGDIASTETLRHAGIERATVVISAIGDWFRTGTTNLTLLRQVRGLTRTARVIVTAENVEHAERLYAAGADYVLLPTALTAEHLQQVLADGLADALPGARQRQAEALAGPASRGAPAAPGSSG
jgi:Kef-type K+ transport system membrane component KefB/Trk K+ transport system NAD-binding subunit